MKEGSRREFPLSDFETLRHELRPADVILVEGVSRVSGLIKLFSRSPWSHAMLYIGRLHDIEDPHLRNEIAQFVNNSEFPQLVLESVLGQGTVITPLEAYRHDHLRICRPKGISRRDAMQVIAFTVTHLGRPYPMRHIFDLARFLLPWSVFPKRWRSSLFKPGRDTDICSSLLAEAFQSVNFPVLPYIQKSKTTGIRLIPRNAKLFTPSDFDYSPFFEIIKYPMLNIDKGFGNYQSLPWVTDGTLSNDDPEAIALVSEN